MKKNLLLATIFILSIAHYARAQIITTFAGGDTAAIGIGDEEPAIDAIVSGPIGLAIDAAGNVYIGCHDQNRIRKVNTTGIITTIAGTGVGSFTGDGGPATNATMNYPYGVAVDNAGNVYFADGYNNCIRKISTSGVISTIAGIGTHHGYNGDNMPATSALLDGPAGVAVDAAGNIYLTDGNNNRIRKVDTSGIITTIAGNGIAADSGDNGPATAAEINNPYSILIDQYGDIYIGGQEGGWVRKISTSGIITAIAGNDTSGFSGDNGPATAAKIDNAVGLALDAGGNLYISDSYNYRIRKVNASGIITTYAGDGLPDYNGDNIPALSANIEPIGLALDGAANLYIADFGSGRVRRIANTVSVTALKNSEDNITVYPNPSNGFFTFYLSSRIDEQARIVITDITGEQVEEIATMTNTTLNVRLNQLAGIYFLTVTTAQGRWTSKLMIEQ